MAVIGAGGCTGVPGASSSAQSQSFWPQPSVRDTVAAAVQPVRDTDNLIPADFSPLIGGGGNAGDGSGVGTLVRGRGNTWLPPSGGPPPQATFYPPTGPVTQGHTSNGPQGNGARLPAAGRVYQTPPPLITPSAIPSYSSGQPAGVRVVWQRTGTAQASLIVPQVAPVQAVFYPLNHPAAAVTRPGPQRGVTRSSPGIYDQAGPQITPLKRPVQARLPLASPPRGRSAGRAGVLFAPATATFYPLNYPARAQPKPPPRGSCRTNISIPFDQPGPQFYPFRQPVTASIRVLPPRGRAEGRAGLFQGSGSQFYPLRQPVTAKVRVLPPRGRTVTRAGTYDQAGPAVTPLQRPVQARQPLPPRGGRTQGRSGVFTATAPAVFYPLNHPAAAVTRPQPARGRTAGRAGTYDQAGPPVIPLHHPVQSRQPLPPRGRSQGRAGVFTATATAVFYPLNRPCAAVVRPQPPRGRASGRAGTFTPAAATAPFYPLNHPVQARQPLPRRGVTRGNPGVSDQAGPQLTPLHGPVRASVRQFGPRGRAQGHPGVFAGSGPPVKPLQHPVYAWRPGPRKGVCLTSVRPAPPVPYIEATFYPLRKPVQARRPLPAHGRILTTPPYVLPSAQVARFTLSAWSPRTDWSPGQIYTALPD